MYIYRGKDALHEDASQLQAILGRQGVSLAHESAVAALASMAGFADYASRAEELDARNIDTHLTEAERSHADSFGDFSYGPEIVLHAPSGFSLRAPAHPDEVTYLRITDAIGRETAFWCSNEWRDDPQLAMGAVLNAVSRGQTTSSAAACAREPIQAQIPGCEADPLHRVLVAIDVTMRRSITVRAPTPFLAATLAVDYAARTGSAHFRADEDATWTRRDYYVVDVEKAQSECVCAGNPA